jgi:IS605 OrfB family transposase
MTEQYRTYQSRVDDTPSEDALMSDYAELYGKTERKLFARLYSGDKDTNSLKREFIKRFRITARQFNSVSAGLKGKISSIKELHGDLIREAEQRIARAKKVLKKISDPAKKHQKKRRLAILQARLKNLKSDRASGKVRLCFGSKKLFRSQFYLKENGYASHSEWLQDWQSARSNQFFVIGSKDESAGCQSCVATIAEDGSITLRLRLPDAIVKDSKYLTLADLRFDYGHNAIVAAIGRNLSDNKEDWQAINYRFVRDDKGWRVFVSVALPEVQTISHKDTGVIGVDINAGHLAVTETDCYGNPVKYFSAPCNTYGKTANQRKAIIGEAVKQIIAFAISRRKPIVIEKLDFQKKKSSLEKQSRKFARMLSSLAYTQIQTILRARAFDAGIEVCEVNPAYTSVIGQYKFKDRYGMSTHNAAALVVGRRSLGFSETLPSQLHGTLPLSVRNRSRHVWSKWAAVSRKAQAALAAHRQSRKGSSLSPVLDKAQFVINPPVTGVVPVCESSLVPFE